MELRYGEAKEAGMLSERIDRAHDLCARWIESGHTPAISVCVARRGVIVLHAAFGKLRPEDHSPPVQLDTIFPVMSINKKRPCVAGIRRRTVSGRCEGDSRCRSPQSACMRREIR